MKTSKLLIHWPMIVLIIATLLVVNPSKAVLVAEDDPLPKGEPVVGLDESQKIYLPLVVKTVKITMWHMWDGAYLQEYQNVISDYQAVHPGVKIELVQQDDLYSALLNNVPKGTGPDLIAWANDIIGDAAQDSLLSPLDSYFNQAYLNTNFEPAAAVGVVWQNHVWGVPESQEGIALVYNKNLISGDQLPNPDDFNDLRIRAQQFQVANPGKHYLCNQGLGGKDAYHVAPIYFGFGVNNYGGYLDENGDVYLDTAEALAAAEWIKAYQEDGAMNGGYQDCIDGFVNGDVAIWWTGPWAIKGLMDAGVNFGIASMGNPFVGIKMYAMTPNAVSRGNTTVVVDLLTYLGNPTVQKRLALVNGTIPANTAALYDPQVQALPTTAGFGASLNRGIPMGNSPYVACQWTPVSLATLAVWNDTQTPHDAMNTAQQAIEQCISEMDDPNQISIWYESMGINFLEYQNIFNEYQVAHPTVHIVAFNPPDLFAYLSDTIPYGLGPDIVFSSSYWAGWLRYLQFISPLDVYINQTYLASNFEPAALQSVILHNQIWGIPDSQEGIALVYNKAVINASLLPDPDNFNDLISKAAAFQAANPGKKYLCNQGLGEPDAYHAAPIYFGFGLKNYGGYVDENGIAHLDTDEALAAGQWIDNFRPYGYLDGSYDNCQNGLVDGNIAIWWTGPWALSALKSAGVGYGIAPMGSPIVGVRIYMLTTNAVDRGNDIDAINLMQYLGTATIQKRLTLANMTIPASTAAIEDSQIQAILDVYGFRSSLNRGVGVWPSPYIDCQWAPVGVATQAIWNETQSPAAALSTAQTDMEVCITQFP